MNSAGHRAGFSIRFAGVARRGDDRILPRSRLAVYLEGIATGRSVLRVKIQNRFAPMVALRSDIVGVRRLFFAGVASEILRCIRAAKPYHFLPIVLNLRVPLPGARVNASVPAREDVQSRATVFSSENELFSRHIPRVRLLELKSRANAQLRGGRRIDRSLARGACIYLKKDRLERLLLA